MKNYRTGNCSDQRNHRDKESALKGHTPIVYVAPKWKILICTIKKYVLFKSEKLLNPFKFLVWIYVKFFALMLDLVWFLNSWSSIRIFMSSRHLFSWTVVWACGTFRVRELLTMRTQWIHTQCVSETIACNCIGSFITLAAVATAHRTSASPTAPSTYTHNNLHVKQPDPKWNSVWWAQYVFGYRYKRSDLIMRVYCFSSHKMNKNWYWK